jgi:hypothetical protein
VRYLRVLNRGRGEDTTWVKVTSILSNPFFQFAMGGSLFCWLGSSTKDYREREREEKKKGKRVAFLWFPCPSPTNFREVTSFSSSFF